MTMNDQISAFDTLRILIGLLFSIGPIYWVPIITSVLYGMLYTHALQNAAVNDERNYAHLETRHWMHRIFRERLSRLHVGTIVYLLCVLAAPAMFFLGVLNTVKR
jgi:hypothetical protein